jgi:hypothetical protein
MFWIVAILVVAAIAAVVVIAAIAVIAVIAVVGWSRGRFSGVPRETGEQRRWKDEGKASYIGHGF